MKSAAISLLVSMFVVVLVLVLLELARRQGFPDPVARTADFLMPPRPSSSATVVASLGPTTADAVVSTAA